MSPEVQRRINKEKKEKTGTLDLRNMGLMTIPIELSELTHLVELDLSANKISKIENLESLTGLNSLYLGTLYTKERLELIIECLTLRFETIKNIVSA